MADVFTKTKRAEVMARIRGCDNKDTELALAQLFRRHGITGWRRQVRIAVEGRKSRVEGKAQPGFRPSTFVARLTVRPDFVFRKLRTAIFVDGCFWHGCPRHATKPKTNAAFWRRKLAGNRRRDVLVTRRLRQAGWQVVRIWECALQRALREAGRERHLLLRLRRALARFPQA